MIEAENETTNEGTPLTIHKNFAVNLMVLFLLSF